jgi:hypothetical protein
MWHLKMTNDAPERVEVGTFESITAAARRIRELEGSQTNGVRLEFYVETDCGTDADALSVFHHTGKRTLYSIRRSRTN